MRPDSPVRAPMIVVVLSLMTPVAHAGDEPPAADVAKEPEAASPPPPAEVPPTAPAATAPDPSKTGEIIVVQGRAPLVEVASMSGGSSSTRSYAAQWLVSGGAELRADLRFLTTGAGPDGRAVRFTDIGLFGVSARAGVGHHVELVAGVDILPKQPSQSDESLLQRIALGLALGPNPRHAIRIDGAGGPMLGDLGLWGSAALSLVRRADIEKKILAYQASLVASGTSLRPDEGDAAWFGEVIGQLELLIHTPGGEAGAWVGTSYALPVIERGTLGGVAIDPQPRLDVHLGGVVALPSGWDLFAVYTVIDRGDAEVASTTVPILDGGYDQRQLLVGVTRRIGGDKPRWGGHDDDYE